MGSLMLADFVIANSSNNELISNYAFIKSVVFIVGPFSLLGFEQIFLRDPYFFKRNKRKILLIVLSVALIVSILIVAFNNFSNAMGLRVLEGHVVNAMFNSRTPAREEGEREGGREK